MTIKLYSWPMSSGTRIAWALEELALTYQYVPLDAKTQEHRSPEMLAVNPHGKVPSLVDGALKLFESGAILLYLGNRYGAAKGLWPEPKGQQALADAVCWTVWAMTELGNYMMQYLYHGCDSPVSYKPEDRSEAAAAYNRTQLDRLLDALETRLEGRDYLMGAFSLVDVAAVSWLLLGTQLGLPLDGHPRVAAWCERCAERPAFKRAR
jgi:glutathione S-transferase